MFILVAIVLFRGSLTPAQAEPQFSECIKECKVFPVTLEDQLDEYYAELNSKHGANLKDALNQITSKNHSPLPSYTTKYEWYKINVRPNVWQALAYTDSACLDSFSDCGKVRLLYLDDTRDLVQAYKGGKTRCQDFWEREHVWPSSRGDFEDEVDRGYTDLHHIRPADKDINGKHSNHGYDKVVQKNDDQIIYDKPEDCPDRKPSALLDKSMHSFEPPDRAKGQVARMLFYMDVRYSNRSQNGFDLSLKAKNVPYNNQTKEPSTGHLCTLLDWNRNHGPTEFEKRRNNRVQELQGNRNPFIDKPELADAIWLNLEEGEKCKTSQS